MRWQGVRCVDWQVVKTCGGLPGLRRVDGLAVLLCVVRVSAARSRQSRPADNRPRVLFRTSVVAERGLASP